MSEQPQGSPIQVSGEGEEVCPEADPVLTFVDSLMSAVGVETVFGEPITVGEQVIIPVAETGIGGGLGYAQLREGQPPQVYGFPRGGGGAGGGANSRPVAVIIITPEGVRVQPIFDLSKIILTGIVNTAALWKGITAFAQALRRR